MKKTIAIILAIVAVSLCALQLDRDDNRVALQTCTYFTRQSITIAASSTWQAVAVPSGAVFAHMRSSGLFAVDPAHTVTGTNTEYTYLPVLQYATDGDSLYVYGTSGTVIYVRWDKVR